MQNSAGIEKRSFWLVAALFIALLAGSALADEDLPLSQPKSYESPPVALEPRRLHTYRYKIHRCYSVTVRYTRDGQLYSRVSGFPGYRNYFSPMARADFRAKQAAMTAMRFRRK